MNPRHTQLIGTMTAEVELQYELLRTWKEYYQLLVEIVNQLSPYASQSRSDLPVSILSDVKASKSATTSPHRTR